jgi:predicted transcriptional regulator
MADAETKTNTATTEEKAKPEPQAKPKTEKQTNCLACGKPIKKLKRYYRNGKFYCNKRCWRKSVSAKEPKQ